MSVADRVTRITERLKAGIDKGFLESNGHRILFAVAVDAIECWLLPLLYDNNTARKTTGCLKAANAALRKSRRNGLPAGDQKFPKSYDDASRGYLKRKELLARGRKNPSLEIFIERLDVLAAAIATERSSMAKDGEDEKGPGA